MENIKTKLLKDLGDLFSKFDHNNPNDQIIQLSSTVFYSEYFNKEIESGKYDLIVEFIVSSGESYEPGVYHSDRGDFEGQGIIYDPTSVYIQNIYLFKNDGDCDFIITRKDIMDKFNFNL